MRERGLGKPLQRRIRQYYEYYLERTSVFDMRLMLSEVRTTLAAQSVCDSSVRGEVPIAPNLLPAVGDIDLGMDTELQFREAHGLVELGEDGAGHRRRNSGHWGP